MWAPLLVVDIECVIEYYGCRRNEYRVENVDDQNRIFF